VQHSLYWNVPCSLHKRLAAIDFAFRQSRHPPVLICVFDDSVTHTGTPDA
jgi:hypothetical protein